jgi:helix-turn-helix protein
MGLFLRPHGGPTADSESQDHPPAALIFHSLSLSGNRSHNPVGPDRHTQTLLRDSSATLAKGISQEALADLAGIHRTYMGSVERGERNISLENIVKIAMQACQDRGHDSDHT